MRTNVGMILALAGCGASGNSRSVDVEVGPPSATASAKPPSEQGAVILWRQEAGEGKLVSVLVDGHGSILAERKEPVALDGLTLVALRTLPEPVDLCKCDGTPATRKVVVGRGALVDLSTNRVERYFHEPYQRDTCDPGLGSANRTIDAHALWGETIFGTLSEDGMGCVAAHPYFSLSAFAYSLASDGELKLEPPAEERARLEREAQETINEASSGCVFDPNETPVLWATTPLFRPNGTVYTRYTFTMGAPYVCGTGPGHYSVAGDVETPQFPARLPPAPLPSFALSEIAKGSIVGVSKLVPPDAVQGLLQVFRSAPLPEPIPQE